MDSMKPAVLAPALALALVLGLLLGGAPGAAQEPELITDRPDQTESAVTVPAGRVQVETGALWTHDDGGRTSREALELASTLVRIGWTERFELRIGVDGWVSERLETGAGRPTTLEGLGDASLGGKFVLQEGSGSRAQIALLAETTVPAGDSEITSDRWDPSVRLAMARDFARFSLGWNLGVEFPDGDEVAFYTLAASFPLGKRRGAFLEIFGDSESSHSLDGGLTFLSGPNFQFDVAAGIGLTDEAPDWFAGLGFSVRR